MIIQKNYFNNETQYVCDFCSEAVTNPICPFCLAIEVDAWSTLYPNLRKELRPKIEEYLKKVDNKINESTRCLKCGSTRTSVCPYCFTKFVFDELEKIGANRRILKEFFEFFNFDLEHTGYTKHAEEIGIT